MCAKAFVASTAASVRIERARARRVVARSRARWTRPSSSSSTTRGCGYRRARGAPSSSTTATRAFLDRRRDGGVERDASSSSSASATLFANAKRAEVRIPGFVVFVDVADATTARGERAVDAALRAGATIVVLRIGGNAAEGMSGKKLYEAAAAMKTLVRGRARVLVADRTDIAASAELDGVVLTDDGVPTVVARKALSETALVVHESENAEEAEKASKEGADLLLVRDVGVLDSIRERVSVPIFVDAREGVSGLIADGGAAMLEELAAKGANGVTIRELVGDEASEDEGNVAAAVEATARALRQSDDKLETTNGIETPSEKRESTQVELVSSSVEETLERERELMNQILDFLRANCSDLDEIKLLAEAQKGLAELFLVVICGEFNAGKSSVINAMLGDKFVAEGILPTTNEIAMLRYGARKSREQTEDGFFNVDLPAELLKQVSIVDTPGTNVILQRQQQLTEEFVPRADLVLFVLSADRPMTESEIKFLTYIRKWGKKVVFVVNKIDLLDRNDVGEVAQFVKDNAMRLLGVTDPAVLPVSSRNALKAKKARRDYADSPEFIESGFAEFEEYVMSFLGGSGERAGEALRLKLSTPLNVSDLLLNAAEQILLSEDDAATEELSMAVGVKDQMEGYRVEMTADAAAQRKAARQVVETVVKRAEAIVDDNLRVSNAASLFTTYVLGSDASGVEARYKSTVLGDAEEELSVAVDEFSAWLKRNNDAQLDAYAEALKARGFDVSLADAKDAVASSEKTSSAVAESFDHDSAAKLLDDAIRKAVNSTIGSAGGAFVIAFFATGFMNSFSEDVLTYALALAGAYISVLSLPLKRVETKSKIRKTAEAFLTELEEALEKECTDEVGRVIQKITTMCAPWEAAARAESARVSDCLDRRRLLESDLADLTRDVANL